MTNNIRYKLQIASYSLSIKCVSYVVYLNHILHTIYCISYYTLVFIWFHLWACELVEEGDSWGMFLPLCANQILIHGTYKELLA